MTNRDKLHAWLLAQGDWLYLMDVPYKRFGMTKETCSSALRDFCNQGRADFRIVGLKQYKANPVGAIKKGPKPPKGMK